MKAILRWNVFFLLWGFALWSGACFGAEVSSVSGFSLRHDPERYGEFLEPKKIEGSKPSMGLALRGDLLAAAGYGHLTLFDVSEPESPKRLGEIGRVMEGRQLVFYGEYLYLTGRTGGLMVVDVRDPEAPVLCAHYDTMELATGLCCADGIAYVSQRQFGTEMIDISEPRRPMHLGFVLSGEAQSVDYANGLLYAGDWGSRELTVIDVREPKNARIIGSGKLAGLGDGVYVRDGICYAATGPRKLRETPVFGHGLDIFSVEDPREPKLIGRFSFPPQAVHAFPDFWSVEVHEDGVAWVSDSFNGVFCLDVSDPADVKCLAHSVLPVGRKGDPDAVGAFKTGKGVVYAAGVHDGVYVIRTPLAKELSPERGSCPSLKTPILPELEIPECLTNDFTIFRTEGQALAAAVWRDECVWVAAGSDGLLLLDVSGGEPKVLRRIPTAGFAYDVKCVGDHLFTAESKAGAAIYRIGEDGSLTEESRLEVQKSGAPVRQVIVPDAGKWMVTKSGNSTLKFFDISNPKSPVFVFTHPIPRGILYGRDLSDGMSSRKTVVCTAQGNGLFWFGLDGERPYFRGTTFSGKVSFEHGSCWVGDRLFYFHDGGVSICREPETFEGSEEPPFIPISGLSRFGKPTVRGEKIVFTNRREGIVSILDIQNPEQPRIVKEYRFHGHPELPVWVKGRMVLPAGHFGVLIEK